MTMPLALAVSRALRKWDCCMHSLQCPYGTTCRDADRYRVPSKAVSPCFLQVSGARPPVRWAIPGESLKGASL